MHYPVILRCTGPSEAWLSPSHGQETCYFGFVVYYAEDGSLSAEGESFLRAVERVLAAEGGRPHWGKYFDESLYDWPALYPQWEAFREVRERARPAPPVRQRLHRRAVRLSETCRWEPTMNAWVTLLTQPNYLVGVRTLRASLAEVGSAYPLVVHGHRRHRRRLAGAARGRRLRRCARSSRCDRSARPRQLRQRPLRRGVDQADGLAAHRVRARGASSTPTCWSRRTWTSCSTMDLPEPAPSPPATPAAATRTGSRATRASWTPENCFYTHCRGVEHTTEPGVVDNYLNGGLLVLTPDADVFADMLARLARSTTCRATRSPSRTSSTSTTATAGSRCPTSTTR